MKRRVLSVAALISLLLGTAVAASWARSYARDDYVDQRTPWGLAHVVSHAGGVRIKLGPDPTTRSNGWWSRPIVSTRGWRTTLHTFYARREAEEWKPNFGGQLAILADRSGNSPYAQPPPAPRPYRVVFFPHWALVATFLLLPTWWVHRVRTRTLAGTCPACGYDLRGTPASKACPECGAEREAIA
jgi:hypothetical protein